MHIVSTSPVLLSFLLSSTILFYLIYLCYKYIYFLFFSWFSLKLMLGYLQSQQQWEIIYTHCCISYSEKIKYIVAENSLSMRSRIIFQTKEQTKKKKKRKKPSMK